MNRTILAVLTATTALAACSAAVQKTAAEPQIVYKTQIVDTGCSWSKLITMTPAEAINLPEDVAGQILAHDREWSAHCAGEK